MEQLRCVICSVVINKFDNEEVKDVVEADGSDETSGAEGNNLTTVLNLLLKSSPNYLRVPSGDATNDVQHRVVDASGAAVLTETFNRLKILKFSVCSDCNIVTRGALESRLRVEQIEQEVTALQQKMLELLRGLYAEMGVFHEEMREIEDIVVSKSVEVENDENTNEGYVQCEEVRVVRDEILEAVTDLRLFQADLQDKLILDRVEEQSMMEVSTHAVEVDVMPEVKIEVDLQDEEETKEEDEDASFINNLINFDGLFDQGDEELREPDSVSRAQVDKSAALGEDGCRFVGHMIGIEENTPSRTLRRSHHQWKEDVPFVCTYCGEAVPTQNRLTRHLKNIHGKLRDGLIPQQLKRPPIRFNNAAVSSEILSKALSCMTRNVEDKDRNTKTLEERKLERKEKLAMLRAQWKTIKKDLRRGNITVKPEAKKKTAAVVKPKHSPIRQQHQPDHVQTTEDPPLPVPDEKPETTLKPDSPVIEDAAVPPSTENSPPSVAVPVTPKKGLGKKFGKPSREPTRRSTRGHYALDMKELLLQQELTMSISNRGRKKKKTEEEVITETNVVYTLSQSINACV